MKSIFIKLPSRILNSIVHLYRKTENKTEGIILKVRRIPIKQRIFLGFLLISILPIALVGTYSNLNYEKSITSKLDSYSGQLVQEMARNIRNETDQYEKLSETIIMNDNVQDGITEYDLLNDIQKNSLYEELTDDFSRDLFNYKNIKNISIRFPNGDDVFYDLGYELFNEKDIYEIIKNTDMAIGNTYWTSLKSNRGSSCIVLSRVLYSKSKYMQKIGYLIIVIDERIFANNTYSIDLGTGSELFIMKSNGVIISGTSNIHKNGDVFGDSKLKDEIYSNYLKNNNTFRYKTTDEDFLIAGTFMPNIDWYLVGKIPYKFISSQSDEVKNTVIYASLIVIVLSVVLSLVIYISVSMPLKSLLTFAKNIGGGTLEERIEDKYDDEISELSYNIKIMVERLKALIEEVKIQQTRKREAELKMLQAQINPHFLFNTLNSLKWSAMLSGNKTLEDGLGALSGLLKDTILNKDELIILGKEIENLNNYATIQSIRYANSFNLSYDIEKGLEKSKVIKFVLQPIVENSILHGIDEDERPVSIKITARNIDDVLLIKISDDGRGFDTESVDSKADKNKLSGIGITNVDERIKINFGQEYGLITKSEPGFGTVTDIALPLILCEEDSNV